MLLLPSESDRDTPVQTHTVFRAIACKEGLEDSDPAELCYTVALPPRTQYCYRILQEGTPDVFCIEDFDKDKMYFVRGKRSGLLIDLGNDEDGDLKGYVDMLADGKPWEAIALHGHWDHLRQIQPLLRAGITVYMNERDVSVAGWGGCDPTGFTNIDEGAVFDLGGCRLRVYAIPGHTEGCLVLVDEDTGDIFASDALGNSRSEIPNSGWLQFKNSASSMECYLSQIQSFRAKTAEKSGRFFGGHNHHILDARLYLDHLQKSVQQAVDEGESGLAVSLRSEKDSFGSSRMAVCGNYDIDLHWAGVNIGTLFQPGLNPENNALLSLARWEGADCTPVFSPYVTDYQLTPKADAVYLIPYSSATRASIRVNGFCTSYGHKICCTGSNDIICVEVTSPDRSVKTLYKFQLLRKC